VFVTKDFTDHAKLDNVSHWNKLVSLNVTQKIMNIGVNENQFSTLNAMVLPQLFTWKKHQISVPQMALDIIVNTCTPLAKILASVFQVIIDIQMGVVSGGTMTITVKQSTMKVKQLVAKMNFTRIANMIMAIAVMELTSASNQKILILLIANLVVNVKADSTETLLPSSASRWDQFVIISHMSATKISNSFHAMSKTLSNNR